MKRSAEGKGIRMKPMPDSDFRLNEMITEDMVADEYDRKANCQLRFQQTSVEVKYRCAFIRTQITTELQINRLSQYIYFAQMEKINNNIFYTSERI